MLPIATLEKAYGWRLPWMTSLLEHPAPAGSGGRPAREDEIAASTLPVQIVTGYYDCSFTTPCRISSGLKARQIEGSDSDGAGALDARGYGAFESERNGIRAGGARSICKR